MLCTGLSPTKTDNRREPAGTRPKLGTAHRVQSVSTKLAGSTANQRVAFFVPGEMLSEPVKSSHHAHRFSSRSTTMDKRSSGASLRKPVCRWRAEIAEPREGMFASQRQIRRLPQPADMVQPTFRTNQERLAMSISKRPCGAERQELSCGHVARSGQVRRRQAHQKPDPWS